MTTAPIKAKEKIKRKLITPIQRFIRIESLSGLLLFGAAIIALVWANSPFRDAYHAMWQYELGVDTEGFSLSKPLILWVNDGLMAVFFFLIGLEIKRELLIGELDSMKKAALPLLAAIGGMAFPVLFFLALNQDPASTPGWGIPMATDIAFTLAILKVLGNRVPLSVKVFLTAFAIVDDIGAVLVIAVFYNAGAHIELAGIALLLLVILGALSARRIYIKYLTFLVGIVTWYLFLKSGVHPTIAGVLLAFTIPIRQRMRITSFRAHLVKITQSIEQVPPNEDAVLSREQMHMIDNLEELMDQVQSPLQHLEYRLHYWVAYLIIPIFALANAGVTFAFDMSLDTALVINIAVALIVGKTLGISLMSLLGVKLNIAALPPDLRWRHVIGVSVLAGVGFTMSIFIANLAFPGEPVLIDSAKLGIMAGSVIAGIIGYAILRWSPESKPSAAAGSPPVG